MQLITLPASVVVIILLFTLGLGCEPVGTYEADPVAVAVAEHASADEPARANTPASLVYATPAVAAPGAVPEVAAGPVRGLPGAGVSGGLPPLTSQVTVYVKLLIKRDFGMLAQFAGRRDHVEQSKPYHPDNDWWDNPLVVYQDTPNPPANGADADLVLSSGVDAPPITGSGESSNIAVDLKLIPHAHIAVDHPDADVLKGTITLTLHSTAAYFDGEWTEMLQVENHPLVFAFDTTSADSPTSAGGAVVGGGRRLEPIAHETRTIPLWTFHRYTRGRQKWDAKSTWPREPESGDWFTTITGRDVKLELTAYRYAAPGPARAPAE